MDIVKSPAARRLASALAILILDYLKACGLVIAKEVKKRIETLVGDLIGAGADPSRIPAMVLRKLGYPGLAKKAPSLALEYECPLEPGEAIEVDGGDGDYECPTCGGTVEFYDGQAVHEEMLVFECPESGEDHAVEADAGEYECPACGLDVDVLDEGDEWKVLHQVRIA